MLLSPSCPSELSWERRRKIIGYFRSWTSHGLIHTFIRTEMCSELPIEHPMTLHECWDMGKNLKLLVFVICSAWGAETGTTNSCVHHHARRIHPFLRHGDGFVILGRRSETQWLHGIIWSRLIVMDTSSVGPLDSDPERIKDPAPHSQVVLAPKTWIARQPLTKRTRDTQRP